MLGQELDERLAQQKRESAMLSRRMEELDEQDRRAAEDKTAFVAEPEPEPDASTDPQPEMVGGAAGTGPAWTYGKVRAQFVFGNLWLTWQGDRRPRHRRGQRTWMAGWPQYTRRNSSSAWV